VGGSGVLCNSKWKDGRKRQRRESLRYQVRVTSEDLDEVWPSSLKEGLLSKEKKNT